MLARRFKLYFYAAFFLFLGFPEGIKAQDSITKDSLLQTAGEYFSGAREKEALDTYLKILELEKNNFEALWHTSLLYARIGFRKDAREQKEEYYQKAFEYAEQTLEEYPDKGHAHFVYAVANGRISDISRTQVRIEKSHIIKKHAEKTLEMIPDYAPAWHLLGIWNSEISNVGSAQKMAAGVFSKGLPEGASNSKAEEYILKAIELDPDQTLRFKLDLARHYNRAGETEKAIQILEEIIDIKPQNEIDEWNLERARELLEELS
ncbi:MAG: hypothetical protein HUJ22_09775 [Gracilimonas sp.]|uniref:tetratricopeptide repeat protein n=1 Tax=Gracilimonas sp. TaxID=1974203 RepID=UPI0019B544DB|nr:hypothetical protein [Gracilimonas sp.]MBD3616849.1 hypothetical protein [Gracilimonas sp.]